MGSRKHWVAESGRQKVMRSGKSTCGNAVAGYEMLLQFGSDSLKLRCKDFADCLCLNNHHKRPAVDGTCRAMNEIEKSCKPSLL